jgi:hypothetical protein
MSMICRSPVEMKIIYLRTEVRQSQFHAACTIFKNYVSTEETNTSQGSQKSLKQSSAVLIGAKRF